MIELNSFKQNTLSNTNSVINAKKVLIEIAVGYE